MSPYKMIHDVMENFEFDKIQSVMQHLDWRWAGDGYKVPSIEQLKRTAYDLLVDAIEMAEKEMFEHDGIAYFSATGGLKAMVFKGENNRVNLIRLEFIIEEWEQSVNE